MPAFTHGTFLGQPGVTGHRLIVLFAPLVLTVPAIGGERAATEGPKHVGSLIQTAGLFSSLGSWIPMDSTDWKDQWQEAGSSQD